MTHNKTPCPKCSGKMEEGFIYDQFDAIRLVSKWVEGVPEKSMWTGVKIKGRKTIETRTFRCDKCGFLESYAKSPTGPWRYFSTTFMSGSTPRPGPVGTHTLPSLASMASPNGLASRLT